MKDEELFMELLSGSQSGSRSWNVRRHSVVYELRVRRIADIQEGL